MRVLKCVFWHYTTANEWVNVFLKPSNLITSLVSIWMTLYLCRFQCYLLGSRRSWTLLWFQRFGRLRKYNFGHSLNQLKWCPLVLLSIWWRILHCSKRWPMVWSIHLSNLGLAKQCFNCRWSYFGRFFYCTFHSLYLDGLGFVEKIHFQKEGFRNKITFT